MKLLSFIFSLFTFSLYATDYRVLVLPCGGATSIINAKLLAHIEKKTGMPTAQLFDEIWGASAGSIIGALLTSPSSRYKSAEAIVHFFDSIFSSYYSAYYIRETAAAFIGSRTIKETSIPLRILTAASADASCTSFTPYDFSSDGTGSCRHTQIPLAMIAAASCTVYPYLFRSPITISLDQNETRFCIDPGSPGCVPHSIIDPTAHFLAQFLPRLTSDDTLTVYFLGNAFTQSLDDEDVLKVLEEKASFDWAIRYEDGTFDPTHRVPIEIVNIGVDTPAVKIIEEYLTHAHGIERTNLKILTAIFKRVVGKQNAAPNLLAAGAIPLSFLKKEAEKMIASSKNFQAMIASLHNK